MTTFIRLLDTPVDAKPAALKAAAAGVGPIFECAPEAFAAVPGSPFSYWVSESVRNIFRHLPPFESAQRFARGGMKSGEDARFVRLWSETGSQDFRAFAKGGAWSPLYADVHLVVYWAEDGRVSEAFYQQNRDVKGGGSIWIPGWWAF